ncbi:hypothetical protein PanWU01x14_185510 [Parasponia andersonii]|uniref:Uncharacterized protein n=1 Tax=Parasponia andersonii TaxID=3476 RepID=A0A2P5C3V8_PARAD|nr:hypothetical protein PanWU01x14_185510 [Parasponia andersonii]
MPNLYATTSHRRRHCPHARSRRTRRGEAKELASSRESDRHGCREAIPVKNLTCLGQGRASSNSGHRELPLLTGNGEFS